MDGLSKDYLKCSVLMFLYRVPLVDVRSRVSHGIRWNQGPLCQGLHHRVPSFYEAHQPSGCQTQILCLQLINRANS